MGKRSASKRVKVTGMEVKAGTRVSTSKTRRGGRQAGRQEAMTGMEANTGREECKERLGGKCRQKGV